MKFLLLLYLIYYLIEGSDSFKDDDDSLYPRVYYLNRRGALSTYMQKNKKNLPKPLRSANQLGKLPSPKVEVKKTIKIPRDQKIPAVKAKSIKRIRPSKLNDKTKKNKRASSKKTVLRSGNNGITKWNKNIFSNHDGLSYEDRDSVETQEGVNLHYDYPGDIPQKLQVVNTVTSDTELNDYQENEKDTAEVASTIKYDKYIEYINPQGMRNDNEEEKDLPKNYKNEIEAGELADMVQNKRHFVPMKYAYDDLGRRFVLQYPYTEVHTEDSDIESTAESQLDTAINEAMQQNIEDERLIPVRANPGLVLSIASESARLEMSKPPDPTREIIQNTLLRTGNYWNSYWKEDVPNPDEVFLRSQKKKLQSKLETVRVKIMPGSKLHQLVSIAKRVSPRLLYIINTNKDAP
ncbi:uncharacterized protein LOC113233627 [Hyposmocoma kahamanoa]|uniref:uncharacterized protein LOC113233627 n=1 Tax=Hyposmocoma kahamanoa TaxID=1477025 RepID=UPI000E6D72A8|nr:uncharacterized protein LOC113233627 [Hyposmocoma kahamanoa]